MSKKKWSCSFEWQETSWFARWLCQRRTDRCSFDKGRWWTVLGIQSQRWLKLWPLFQQDQKQNHKSQRKASRVDLVLGYLISLCFLFHFVFLYSFFFFFHLKRGERRRIYHDDELNTHGYLDGDRDWKWLRKQHPLFDKQSWMEEIQVSLQPRCRWRNLNGRSTTIRGKQHHCYCYDYCNQFTQEKYSQ